MLPILPASPFPRMEAASISTSCLAFLLGLSLFALSLSLPAFLQPQPFSQPQPQPPSQPQLSASAGLGVSALAASATFNIFFLQPSPLGIFGSVGSSGSQEEIHNLRRSHLRCPTSQLFCFLFPRLCVSVIFLKKKNLSSPKKAFFHIFKNVIFEFKITNFAKTKKLHKKNTDTHTRPAKENKTAWIEYRKKNGSHKADREKEHRERHHS